MLFGAKSALVGSQVRGIGHYATLQGDFFWGRIGRKVFRTFFDALGAKSAPVGSQVRRTVHYATLQSDFF